MNLIIFDCDDTIWNIPYEENDKFMDTPESLEYDFKYKQEIVDIYNDRKKNSNNKIVILTNRIDTLKNKLLNKLEDEQNIVFDYQLFRSLDRDKSHRLKDLLRTLDNIEEVEFYDDKEKHIKSINKLKTKFFNINFKINKVQ